jgi:hypothetical protein
MLPIALLFECRSSFRLWIDEDLQRSYPSLCRRAPFGRSSEPPITTILTRSGWVLSAVGFDNCVEQLSDAMPDGAVSNVLWPSNLTSKPDDGATSSVRDVGVELGRVSLGHPSEFKAPSCLTSRRMCDGHAHVVPEVQHSARMLADHRTAWTAPSGVRRTEQSRSAPLPPE